MHVSLTPELENMIKMKVSSGLYNNASEVMREALRKMYTDDEVQRMKFERLRDALAMGMEDIKLGRTSKISVDELLAELKGEI